MPLSAVPAVQQPAADDAAAAKWWPLNELPPLAFDHDKILADAKRALKPDVFV